MTTTWNDPDSGGAYSPDQRTVVLYDASGNPTLERRTRQSQPGEFEDVYLTYDVASRMTKSVVENGSNPRWSATVWRSP